MKILFLQEALTFGNQLMVVLISTSVVIGMVLMILNMFTLTNIFLNITLQMVYSTLEMMVGFIKQKIMELYGQILVMIFRLLSFIK